MIKLRDFGIISLVLFFISAVVLHAQGESDELVIEKYRYSTVNFIQVDISDSQKRSIVYDAILNQVTGSGFNVLGTADIYDIATESESPVDSAIAYAASLGADTAIIFNVILQEENGLEMVLIQSRVYRTSDRKMITSINKKAFIDYTLIKTVDRIAEKLHEKSYSILFYSEEENMSSEEKLLVRAKPCTITVFCDYDGAEVYLSDTDLMGTIQNGKLVLPFHPLALNQELKVTVKLEGYYNQEETVSLDQEEIHIEIGKLYKAAIAAFDLYYAPPSFAGLGMGGRFYPVRDDLFLELRDSIFATGFLANDDKLTMIHNDFSFQVGYYPVLPGNRFFRFSIAVGLGYLYSGVIDSTVAAADRAEYHDWYITLFDVKLELNLPTLSVFMGPEMRYFNPVRGDKALLPNGLLAGEGASSIIVNMGVLWKF